MIIICYKCIVNLNITFILIVIRDGTNILLVVGVHLNPFDEKLYYLYMVKIIFMYYIIIVELSSIRLVREFTSSYFEFPY